MYLVCSRKTQIIQIAQRATKFKGAGSFHSSHCHIISRLTNYEPCPGVTKNLKEIVSFLGILIQEDTFIPPTKVMFVK